MLHIIWKHNHWTHSLTAVSNSRFSWSHGKRPANSRSHVASQLSEHDRTLCGTRLPGKNKPWDKMMDLYVSVIYPNLLFVTVTCYLFFICKSNLIELSQQFYYLDIRWKWECLWGNWYSPTISRTDPWHPYQMPDCEKLFTGGDF